MENRVFPNLPSLVMHNLNTEIKNDFIFFNLTEEINSKKTVMGGGSGKICLFRK